MTPLARKVSDLAYGKVRNRLQFPTLNDLILDPYFIASSIRDSAFAYFLAPNVTGTVASESFRLLLGGSQFRT